MLNTSLRSVPVVIHIHLYIVLLLEYLFCACSISRRVIFKELETAFVAATLTDSQLRSRHYINVPSHCLCSGCYRNVFVVR